MKKITLLIMLLMVFVSAGAQVTYNYGWEPTGLGSWTNAGTGSFSRSTTTPCAGTASARANVYYDGTNTFTSPSLGTSNGGPVSFAFNYKATLFSSNTTGAPAAQVQIDVQWANSTGGPWTTFHSINSASHVVSASCASVVTSGFTPGAGNLYVRFLSKAVGSSTDIYYYYDDIVVSQGAAPSCVSPSALVSSSITNSSATISWTASPSSPTGGYDYFYGTSNTAPTGSTTPTGSVGAGVTSVNLSSLFSNTAYYFWVRSNCGGGDNSTWTGPLSFRTLCDPYNVPYFEGFESGYTHNTSVGGCLSQASITGTETWTANNSLTDYNRSPRTGAWNAFLHYSNNDWLFIPINLTAGTSYTVSLYARQDGATATNSDITVSYGTLATDAGMTNAIVPTTGIINGSYQQLSGAFTPNSTGVFYVGIKGYMNGTPWYISLDDISIDVTPACAPPTGLAVNSITYNSASFVWNATSGNYQYVLDNSSSDPSGAGTALAGETFSINSLAPLTTYYFHVRTDCGGTFSAWSTISFTTLATPPANDDCTNAVALTPGGVYSDNPVDGTNAGASTSSQTAPTTCFGFSGGDVWYSVVVPASGNITIETGTPVGGGAGIDTVITAYSGDCAFPTQVGCDDDGATESLIGFSKLVLTGQTPGSMILIRAYEYGNNATGNFGISAYDASLSTGSFDSASFKAYPNPVKDVLNLSYATDITSVEVYNMLGQNVMTKTLNVSQGQIDMSNLNAGNYIVKVTADGLTKTIKVIKQ